MSSQPGNPAGWEDEDSSALEKKFSRSINVSNTKTNLEYSTEMNRWFLRPIGVWPVHPDAGLLGRITSELRVATCYFLICFLLVPCGLHTFLEENDPALRLKMIGPLSFCLMAITKYCFLVMRRNEIFTCLEHIAKDWTTLSSPQDRRIMLRDAKFGRFVASLCAAFMYGGGFFYHTIMPLSSGTLITEQNVSFRPLVYPVYDALLDTMTSPTYEIVFVTQWFSGFVMYTITIGACSIAAVFAMHACGQFKILIARLGKLVDGDDGHDNVDDRMADIVQLHLRALGFVSRVESILTEVCLVEFVGCTMNICFLGYYFMTEWERSEAISTVTYCVLLVSFTFNILIFCYIGEMLTEEGKRVGTVTYMIDWYRLQGTRARSLILVLVMSKNPASITAGKMAELSLSSFCGVGTELSNKYHEFYNSTKRNRLFWSNSKVLRTALTYLNLLRQVAS